MATERTTWTTPKAVAAVLAALSVLLLMTDLHTWIAQWFSLREVEADGWFTGVLSGIIVACAIVLYREAASLRITVILLSLGMFLVFAGTLAQTRLDIWEVIRYWFRGRAVDIPLKIFVNPFDKATFNEQLDGPTFRFPGGFLILGLLTINMCAAMGAKIRSDLKSSARGRLLRRHAGIYILHVGLLVMFAGEYITGFYAQEGNLTIQAGSWADFIEDHMKTELAFVDPSDPDKDKHVVIPQALLEKHAVIGGDGEPISHPDLPFDIRVEDFMPNAVFAPGSGHSSLRGMARLFKATEIPPYPGTEMRKEDTPAMYVTLLDKDSGEAVGTWLCAAIPAFRKIHPEIQVLINRPEETAKAKLESEQYAMPVGVPQPTLKAMPEIELRFARRYMPYRVYLVNVDHDVYDGTGIPHNYSSDVRVVMESGELDRESRIWMNNPMRYDQKAFYQRQMDAGSGLTVLQVVTNPGIWLPYISCGIVTLGLVIQFSVSLVGYTRRVKR